MILIAGMPGAGKSMAIQEFEKKNIPIVEMGDVIREETKNRGYDPNPENTGKIACKLRKELGDDAIAKLCVEKIRKIDQDLIVVDGVRSLAEKERFEKDLDENIEILSIHSDPKTRYKRLKERGREDDPENWEEFNKRDLRELNFGIGKVIALSDHIIVNDSTIRNLRLEVEKYTEEKL